MRKYHIQRSGMSPEFEEIVSYFFR